MAPSGAIRAGLFFSDLRLTNNAVWRSYEKRR